MIIMAEGERRFIPPIASPRELRGEDKEVFDSILLFHKPVGDDIFPPDSWVESCYGLIEKGFMRLVEEESGGVNLEMAFIKLEELNQLRQQLN